MSINPLDLQVAIPKSVEVSNIKQIEIQKNDVYVQQFAISYDNENKIKKNRINKTNETFKMHIKGNNEKRNEKEKKKKENKFLGHIDIKV
ncbi:hypothetical protein ACETAC_06615 [Aceticella autotrophica]|uniref:Uncharacterized protein n=1 Tax=Aceticella autotrophica TaxID=2755338 RepID=A0A974Y2X6_9THEO|nr:hypothetical protein [Aceticella autotrophica]QSZ26583.1 hypothetical protein ACETAC_06615 [Aceticella autotrophica]